MVFTWFLIEYTDYLVIACIVMQRRSARLIRINKRIREKTCNVGTNLLYRLKSRFICMRIVSCPSPEHPAVRDASCAGIVEHRSIHCRICSVCLFNIDSYVSTTRLMEDDFDSCILSLIYNNIYRESLSLELLDISTRELSIDLSRITSLVIYVVHRDIVTVNTGVFEPDCYRNERLYLIAIFILYSHIYGDHAIDTLALSFNSCFDRLCNIRIVDDLSNDLRSCRK